jgi:peroxiredoxin family protein
MNTNTRVKEEARVTTTEQTATGKLSIIMFSGTADKFIPLGVISQAAAAMGIQVNIFVTGFALQGFTKKPHDLPFPTEFAGMAPALAQGLKASHVPSWDAMLRQAKELGAKVYTCSMMAGVMGLAKADFNELVDDVVGAATFLQASEGGQTFFI